MADPVQKIPFFYPSFSREEEEAAIRVLRSGWLTTGNETLLFEKEFARFVDSPHALAVNSASSGLILAMEAFGVGPGKSIVTTPYTFISTATAARHLGAEVLYADIEATTYNIDPAAVETVLDQHPEACAVVPVHIAGNVCRMDEIHDLCAFYGKKHGHYIAVIEDAAHAFPAKTDRGYAGTLADAGVFSFYATKTITSGEGGMICVRDADKAKRMSIMRSHGIDRPVWDRYTAEKASWIYDVVDEGWKFNLPDILSAIGRVQLSKARSFFDKRLRIVQRYNDAFSGSDALILPPDSPGNAWHLYLLRIVPEALDLNRDGVARELQERGIGISLHFIPHFEMTWYKQRYGSQSNRFPHAERQYERTISIPLWPDMSDGQVSRVIDTVLDCINRHRK